MVWVRIGLHEFGESVVHGDVHNVQDRIVPRYTRFGAKVIKTVGWLPNSSIRMNTLAPA